MGDENCAGQGCTGGKVWGRSAKSEKKVWPHFEMGGGHGGEKTGHSPKNSVLAAPTGEGGLTWKVFEELQTEGGSGGDTGEKVGKERKSQANREVTKWLCPAKKTWLGLPRGGIQKKKSGKWMLKWGYCSQGWASRGPQKESAFKGVQIGTLTSQKRFGGKNPMDRQ